MGALNSWNPQALSRPVMGLIYLYIITIDITELIADVKFDKMLFFTTAWRVRNLRLEVRPSDMECSCQYVN
jgi:hypothetical protein